MSVVVAHQASASGRRVLHEAAKEASLRRTALTVIHIAEGVDIDIIEAQRKSLRAEISAALGEVDLTEVTWTLQVETGADVAETLLDLVANADVDVELLVVGARRRSPVGKMIMGSVTQTLILRADAPVLVITTPARSRSRGPG